MAKGSAVKATNGSANPEGLYFDTVIIGAGISGINAAYRIQEQGPSEMSYVILENRENMGGTWDLFKYPGIRSDSDIFTFGFPWSPWTRNESLASGDHIKEYVKDSAAKFGIDNHICYRHGVQTADWHSDKKQWELTVKVGDDEKLLTYRCRFLLLGTGYYDYSTPRQTSIPGIENFEGKIIHPQFWDTEYDYSGKDVVIIGSGATAVTVLPSMADKAKKVTMLQRSPSYIFPLPSRTFWTQLLFMFLPASIAHFINRLVWLIRSHATTWFCILAPNIAKAAVKYITVKNLPPDIKFDPNFKPRYNPWEQRFCACQDGDFFAALRSGKGDVVTDKIKTVTKNSIELESGKALHPDLIVTATGLKIRFGGGIQFALDGKKLNLADKFAWKSAMLEDVPNLLFITGYETASWTLGADVSTQLFIRILNEMGRKKATVAVPRVKPTDNMPELPMMSLESTYLKNAMEILPKGGIGQWAPKKNYFMDMAGAKWGDIKTGLEMY